MLNSQIKVIYTILISLFLSACASTNMKPIQTVNPVDLNRFMGDWYVIAAIPTFIETASYNAIENYAMNADGSIATTFTFNKGSLDGPAKDYHPKGFPDASTGNGVWGMQFMWPIKADYRIAYLDANYQTTVIARNARDYVWIMARSPVVPSEEYNALVKFVAELGYDIKQLRKVPHNAQTKKPHE